MTEKFHLPMNREIKLGQYTESSPLRMLISECLNGESCVFDGSSFDKSELLLSKKLSRMPNVNIVTFCPENFSFGTPRDLADLHGGNGFDVLDGKARVLSDKGEDWTDRMINAAHEMLRIAKENRVEVALLLDMSAACGSQVISDGCRLDENRRYQKGPGVCSALLMRNKIHVLSQRDYKSLDRLLSILESDRHESSSDKIDHHESEWYLEYFKN